MKGKGLGPIFTYKIIKYYIWIYALNFQYLEIVAYYDAYVIITKYRRWLNWISSNVLRVCVLQHQSFARVSLINGIWHKIFAYISY